MEFQGLLQVDLFHNHSPKLASALKHGWLPHIKNTTPHHTHFILCSSCFHPPSHTPPTNTAQLSVCIYYRFHLQFVFIIDFLFSEKNCFSSLLFLFVSDFFLSEFLCHILNLILNYRGRASCWVGRSRAMSLPRGHLFSWGEATTSLGSSSAVPPTAKAAQVWRNPHPESRPWDSLKGQKGAILREGLHPFPGCLSRSGPGSLPGSLGAAHQRSQPLHPLNSPGREAAGSLPDPRRQGQGQGMPHKSAPLSGCHTSPSPGLVGFL